MHCPSKFPLIYYAIPKYVKERLPIEFPNGVIGKIERKSYSMWNTEPRYIAILCLKWYPGLGYSRAAMKRQMRENNRGVAKTRF